MNIQNKISFYFIVKIKEARKDAASARKYAEADGNSDYAFWDGYVNGMDYAIFILEEAVAKEKIKKKVKKEKKKKK